MQLITSILKDFKGFFNVKTRKGLIRSILLIVLVLVTASVAFKINSTADVSATTSVETVPTVKLKAAGELAAASNFSTIGKVEAVSQANLQTEASGRVTTVNTKIGDTVPAGKILATIENSSQRAALLQAEGAYEAAKAGAAQGNLGVNQANNSVAAALDNINNANRSAYNSTNSVLLTSIDQFYNNPTNGIIGLRIESSGQTLALNNERINLRSIMSDWQTSTLQAVKESSADLVTDNAIANTNKVIHLVDTFITLTTNADFDATLAGRAVTSYTAELQANRASLNSTLANLTSAKSALQAALQARSQAEIGGTNTDTSAANAQVKIALGSLQAAQAAYSKTLVRTPISGVVNAFYLKEGDYVSQSQPAAIVANNNGLQIKTYVNEVDAATLEIGDKVSIGNDANGVIAAKADALDPTTGKFAIIISIENSGTLVNGATVSITFTNKVKLTDGTSNITIPLSALKITSAGPNVFKVKSGNVLELVPVTLGKLTGDSVEILSGVSSEEQIVVDARGLSEGTEVVIEN